MSPRRPCDQSSAQIQASATYSIARRDGLDELACRAATVILDARGLQQLLRSRLAATPDSLPVVTIDPELAQFSDAYFSVGDRETWSSVANLLKERRA